MAAIAFLAEIGNDFFSFWFFCPRCMMLNFGWAPQLNKDESQPFLLWMPVFWPYTHSSESVSSRFFFDCKVVGSNLDRY